MAGKQVLKQKVKKKKWHAILAPALFNHQHIGESYIESVESLKGKYVSANLSTITNDMKKQHINVTLRVNKVIEGQGHTEIIGMNLLQSNLKRLVRRGRTKVDNSFVLTTKDGALIRIKPMILTSSVVSRPVSSEVRRMAKEFLTQRVSSQNFYQTIHEILLLRIQKELKMVLSSVTPVRSVDIRVFERERVRGSVPEHELSEQIDQSPAHLSEGKPAKKKPIAPDEGEEDEEEVSVQDSENDEETQESDDDSEELDEESAESEELDEEELDEEEKPHSASA